MEAIDCAIQFIFGHLPFIMYTTISAVCVQTAKISIWTKDRIMEGKLKSFFWWGRKTLPAHPVLIGLLVGLFPGVPLSDGMSETLATKCLYFASAGALSTWIFDIIKALAKKKYGLDFDASTESSWIFNVDKTPVEIPAKLKALEDASDEEKY